MNYIYCKNPTQDVIDLSVKLEAKILRRFDGMDFYKGSRRLQLEEGASIICMGDSQVPELDGIRVLSSNMEISDFRCHQLIYAFGFSMVEWTKSSEDLSTRYDRFIENGREQIFFKRNPYHYDLKLQSEGRDGMDFFKHEPDSKIWVRRMNFGGEYHFYLLDGKIIRAGIMKRREGSILADSHIEWIKDWKKGKATSHPWIKTDLTGWYLDFGLVTQIPAKTRQYVTQMVKSLDWKNGKIKLGDRGGGMDYSLISYEANPIIPEEIQASYLRGFQKWLKGNKKLSVSVPNVVENRQGIAAEVGQEGHPAGAPIPPFNPWRNLGRVNPPAEPQLPQNLAQPRAIINNPNPAFAVDFEHFILNQNVIRVDGVVNMPVDNPGRLGVVEAIEDEVRPDQAVDDINNGFRGFEPNPLEFNGIRINPV